MNKTLPGPLLVNYWVLLIYILILMSAVTLPIVKKSMHSFLTPNKLLGTARVKLHSTFPINVAKFMSLFPRDMKAIFGEHDGIT